MEGWAASLRFAALGPSLAVCLSVSLFLCLCVSPSNRLAGPFYIFLRVSMTLCLFVCMFLRLSVYLGVCLSVCLPVCLSPYLSVCLSARLQWGDWLEGWAASLRFAALGPRLTIGTLVTVGGDWLES